MSLQQLLAEHSRDIAANLSHTQEMAQDNVDRKANDLEEKFQHAKDSIEGLGGEIAAGSAAYHMGRKIYTKYQEKYGKRQPAQRQVPEEERKGFGSEESEGGGRPRNQPSSDDAAQSEEGRSASGDAGETSGAGGEEPVSRPTTTDAEADPSVGAAADDDVAPVSNSTISDADEAVAKQLDDAYPNSGLGDSYRASAQAQANRSQQLQNQQAEQRQLTTEQTEAPAVEAEQGESIGGRGQYGIEEDVREPVKADEPTGDLGRNIASDDSEDVVKAKTGDESDFNILKGEEGAENAGSKGTTVATAAEDGASGAADAEGIGAKALGSLTSTGLEAGLDTASAVLDALGPIGEGLGVITSLVGLFEGLHHHKKDVNEQSDIGGANAGIDTSALKQTSSVGVVA